MTTLELELSMNKTLTTWTVAAAVLTCGSSLRAHHSVSMFDLAAPIWVKGTVARYEPTNPHVMFTLEEKVSDTQVQSWRVEGPSLVRLGRLGAGENFLKAGDVVEACGFPPKQEFVGPSSPAVRRYPVNQKTVHGHVLVMPDGRMRSWGSYGKLDNCIRPGDQAQMWVEFLTREPLARDAWCNSTRGFVKIASLAPKALVDEIDGKLTDRCG
jgi:hypothetical protein